MMQFYAVRVCIFANKATSLLFVKLFVVIDFLLMNIPPFEEIVEQNDQTEARRSSLDALRALVGNVYPNKFERSTVSGSEDTISNVLRHPPVVEIVDEINAVIENLAERE